MGASVSFLWHMHQPYYKDPLLGAYLMPWVRLHATKGYYDMISILEDFPDIRQTFNLVPSLIDQLQDYSQDGVKEKWLELSLKPAAELSFEDKKFILHDFFMANWDNLVFPRAHYKRLLQKRGMKATQKDLEYVAGEFTTQEFLDLQVLFNLVWFGYRARKKYPFLVELDSKKKDYTEEEKLELMRIQRSIAAEILPAYKRFSDKGQIEISFSPYYHPILPLLCDTEIAKRSMPWASLPRRFSHPEDAKAQVEKSCALYQKLFGKKMRGMWPSEGSVCPEMIPIWADAGIRWVATDEEILLHSTHVKDRGKGLYRSYSAEHGGKSVGMVFRDRGLSDLVGFTYSKNQPAIAAQDLLSHLRTIDKYNENENGALISIILDGENPWENYKDGGEEFLSRLYGELSRDRNLKTVTIGEFMEQHRSAETLTHLHSGSWIAHNFDIWIGDPEENEGWDYLGRTRNFLVNFQAKHPDFSSEKLAQAWEEIYRAEGSDWFWWYGEDFASAHDEEFDLLFRTHLANVYHILGETVPDHINNPIQGFKAVRVSEKPVGLVSPMLDGICTDFYEWHHAGIFHMKKGTTMYKSETFLEAIYYGFDLERLYFRFDPTPAKNGKMPGDLTLQLNILKKQAREFSISIPFLLDVSVKHFSLSRAQQDQAFQKMRDYDTIGVKKIIELGVPTADLGFSAGEELEFFVQILQKDIYVERYPRAGYISFHIPGKDYENEMWNA